MRILTLRVLDRAVRIDCTDPATQSLVTIAYGSMHNEGGEPDLDYTVGREGVPAAFFIERKGRERLTAVDDGRFLALFDEDFAIEIQKLRRDLYFVHAGVLRRGGVAAMFVTKPGGGKSTLCWALLHHGFDYLSDELAPGNLATLEVHPFTRALALKKEPPASHPLPPTATRTSRGFHVRIESLPAAVVQSPTPLAAVFFLSYVPGPAEPAVKRISAAEAAARLYANALNPLAHRGDGLDGALRIATAHPCFDLTTADLTATCALVTATLEHSL